MEHGELDSHNERLLFVRTSYNDGAVAARSGEPLAAVPDDRAIEYRQAWLNGWYDATVHIGLAAVVMSEFAFEAILS